MQLELGSPEWVKIIKQWLLLILHKSHLKEIITILLKKDINNKTITKYYKLNNDQRIEEIARMLSGNSITDEARRAAAKLLG